MTKSKNLGLNLPSRDNTTDLADVNVISENFETIDNEFENVYNKLNNTGVVNTASGSPIVLKDSANAPLQNLKLFGKTTQNGTPTPEAPVPIVSVGDSGSLGVGVYGKNLLNVPKSIDFSNADMVFKNIKCPLKKDETCTLSFFSSIGGANYQFTYTGVSGTDYRSTTLQTASEKKTVYTFTPIEDVDIVRLYIDGTGSLIECMIEKGGFTGYQEFNKQTLTMPYTLRGVGDVEDEVDLERGVYIENTYKKVFTGDETTLATLSSTGGGTYFTYVDGNIAYNTTTGMTGAFCNRLTEKTNNELWATTNQGFCFGSSSQQFRFRIDGCTTVAELQAKLKEWYNGDNPLTIIVKSATPIETPLTETELNAYKKLHTNKPTTTILCEADMEVSYVADTKLYIDNKIAELTALTLEG